MADSPVQKWIERGLPLDPDGIAALFDLDGPLARVLPAYEPRAAQVKMARSVAGALNGGGVALIEAGTGTGKSLAYLIPAALFALASKSRVVIATHTISLQEQILNKDLPIAAEALGVPVKAVLVKGWRNYLCRLRLQRELQAPAELFEPPDRAALQEIAAWTEGAREGSLSEWARAVPEVWERVAAESDTCLRGDCPHYGDCFLFGARRAMTDAHLLIVNHHLLFADAAVRRELGWETEMAVLPRYAHVVLDEAHHLEEVATDHFGLSVTEAAVDRLLARIYRKGRHRRSGAAGSGLAATWLERTARGGSAADRAATLVGTELVPAVGRGEEAAHTLFAALEAYLRQSAPSGGGQGEGQAYQSPLRAPGGDAAWERAAAQLGDALAAVEIGLRRVRAAERAQGPRESHGAGDVGPRRGSPEEGGDPALLQECEALADRCSRLQAHLAFMAGRSDPGYVYWLQSSGARGHPGLYAAPLGVGDHMTEWVDNMVQTLIATSATLTVGGRFAYLRERLQFGAAADGGGTEGPVQELVVDSPFDYASQALIGLPTDLPDPAAPEFPAAVAEALAGLLPGTRGRAFVLFTSHRMLRDVARRLAPAAAAHSLSLLLQGEAARSALLDRFKSTPRAVLFGTDSFWEGVDVPGEALSLVVLVKLPFQVPTEPVLAARLEQIAAAGRRPFAELTLPQAVLKLRQGFGRLIRTRTDRGAVLILDRRISQKEYGRVFLRSLPRCAVTRGPYVRVAAEVLRWLQK